MDPRLCHRCEFSTSSGVRPRMKSPRSATGVVAVHPALELAVELGRGVEALPVERRPVELLEHRALEPLAHGVVVGRTGRDAVVVDATVGHGVAEGEAGELRPVVAEDAAQLDADGGQALHDVVDEGDGALGGLVAHEELHDRPARGGVDGGELPHLGHALEEPDVEGVEGHEVARAGGEVAEAERPGAGVVGHQAAVRRGDLGEGAHPLGATPQAVAHEQLLHARRRQHDAALGQVLDQPACAEGRPRQGLGQHCLDDVGWRGVGHHGRTAVLGHQRGEAVAAGTACPPVIGRAADAVVAADLGDGLVPRLVQDDEASMVDVCSGVTAVGSSVSVEGNKGSTAGPARWRTCNVNP